MIDFSIFEDITDNAVISNDEEYVSQQIDLLFNTDSGSVLGDLSFGSNYDRYLYTTGISNYALENKILGDIRNLDLRGYTPSVTVTLMEGTIRDIAIIDITLTGEYEMDTFSRSYKIK